MTELITKLIQRQTLSAGRINLNQRHCYDTAIQTQTNRLMQRLELPEKQMRRYIGGILRPDAIAQRFNLRRVELTEWGQPADLEVLPGKLQSTPQPSVSVPPFGSPSISPSVSPSISASVPSSISSSISSSVSASASPDEAFSVPQPSLRSSFSEKSAIHPSSNSARLLETPSALPEATFRIRRGGSHSALMPVNHTSKANAVTVATTEPETPSLVLARSTEEVRSASPQSGSEATTPDKVEHTLPLPLVKAAIQKKSAIAASPNQMVAQTLKSASEGRLVLPVKGKLSRLQETTESTDSFLPIAVKARTARSQLTLDQTPVSLPELLAVKPQLRLATVPTTSNLSLPLPLMQRQIHPIPQAASDEATAVSPSVANQRQLIHSAPPTVPVETINIDKVAEEVSRLLSRRLMLERERRGIRP